VTLVPASEQEGRCDCQPELLISPASIANESQGESAMNYRNLTRELADIKGEPLPLLAASEETLVSDLRSGLTLAQMVERRVRSLLRGTRLPVNPLSKFKPTAAGQITQGVTRFEFFPSKEG
jgi:hypothetical protein